MTPLRRSAALAVAAQLAARQRKAEARGPGDHGPEHGLAMRRVEVVDAADPAAPDRTIRRARVADPVARMANRGEISKALQDAADELRALAEASQYASRSSLGALDTVRGGQVGAGLPPPSVALAAVRYRAALLAAWPYGPVLLWVVIENRTLGTLARRLGVKPGEASDALKAGLRLLSAHFALDVEP